MLEPLVQAAKDIVDELTIPDARAQITESVGHVLHLRHVVDDGEISLVEAVELVTEKGRPGVAIVAEDGAERAPESTSGDVAGVDDGEGGGRDRAVVPGDDGEVIEHPIRGALSGRAVDVIPKAELAKGGEELATPEAVVVLLVVEDGEDVVADAKTLELRGGEWLGCNGDAETEVLDRAVGRNRRRRNSWRRLGDWIGGGGGGSGRV